MLSRQNSCQVPSTQPTTAGLQRVNSVCQIGVQDNIYEMIVTHNVIKRIQIVNIVKEKDTKSLTKKHVVNYVIQIGTDYFDYQILRRYKEFAVLYAEMKSQLTLPKFPEKCLFQANKKKVIDERRFVFENILQAIVHSLLVINYYPFLQFIQIREQFLKRGCTNILLHCASQDQIQLSDLLDPPANKYQPQNEVERTLFHYVQQLNQQVQERGKIFKKLNQYLFGKMNQVSQRAIHYFFNGDPDQQILGLIEMLRVDCITQEHHIACIQGFHLLRRFLEYDYNPYAEQTVKVLCEVTMKQMKQMKIANHIKTPKKCTQNALFVLHKYVLGNPSLNEKFLAFLLEDEETCHIYESYRVNQRKVLDSYKTLESSEDNLSNSGETAQRKCSSKDMTLEEEQSPEGLANLTKGNLNWKFVTEYRGCRLEHMYGQYVKTTYAIPCTIERAYELFTKGKKWKKQFNKFEIIETIDNENFIALEEYTWSQKSIFQRFAFISQFQVQRSTERISLKVMSLKDYTKSQLDLVSKEQKLCSKVSYVIIEKTSEGCVVVNLKNLVDQEHKLHYYPILLNEDDSFKHDIDSLYQQI